MTLNLHRAEQHRSAIRGIEACSIASNQSFPRHAHDQFGIGVIASGAQRSWSGIGPVDAGAGDIITVNPGEMHDGTPVQGQVRRWQMLYIDPGILSGAMTRGVELARPALQDTQLAGRFAQLFASITDPVPDALAVEEDLLRTMGHLLSRYANRPAPARGTPPSVARALARLDAIPERPVTLADLAALSGVSRFQLLRGFVRAVGITPHAYLLQQRVRLARRLLVAGRRPAEAAAEAGFADQSHLTRAFRRQLGVTPARYRAGLA